MNAEEMSTRKKRRRANLAREKQGWFRSVIKYMLFPGIFLYFVSEVVPDTRIPLKALVVFPLLGFWIWWATGRIALGLDYVRPILGWQHKEAIDDLRDDIRDETGIQISRNRMTEHILAFAYQADGLKDHLINVARNQ